MTQSDITSRALDRKTHALGEWIILLRPCFQCQPSCHHLHTEQCSELMLAVFQSEVLFLFFRAAVTMGKLPKAGTASRHHLEQEFSLIKCLVLFAARKKQEADGGIQVQHLQVKCHPLSCVQRVRPTHSSPTENKNLTYSHLGHDIVLQSTAWLGGCVRSKIVFCFFPSAKIKNNKNLSIVGRAGWHHKAEPYIWWACLPAVVASGPK